MSHLNLSQSTSSVEVVSSAIIDKLYELAQTNLDESSDVQGNIQVVHAYEDAVAYLLAKFTNLQINVTGGAYIRFADNNVLSILLQHIGDGTGITSVVSNNCSDIYDWFVGSNITTFNELSYFNNMRYLGATSWNGSGGFKNCSMLINAYLTNIQTLRYNAFIGCSKLININLPNCTQIYRQNFTGCTNLVTFSAPNAVWVDNSDTIKFLSLPKLTTVNLSSYNGPTVFMFKDCPNLINCDISNVATLGGSVFENDISLKNLTFNKLTSIYPNSTFSGTQMDWIKILTPTVCSLGNINCFSNTGSVKIYVPDDSVASYKAATNWSTYASRIFPLSQFATDFPNG